MKRITIKSLGVLFLICLLIIGFGDEDCDFCYSFEMMMVKLIIAGLVLIIGSIYFTSIYKKFERMVFDIECQPLLETNEASPDVVFAGEGKVAAEKILKSPYTDTDCVYYHSILEQYVKRGKRSRWEIKKNLTGFVPFYLVDERGRLKIDLSELDHDTSSFPLNINRSFSKYKQMHSEMDCEAVVLKKKFTKKVKRKIFSSNKQYRKSEFALRPNSSIFVHGHITKKDGELILTESDIHPLIISNKSQKDYIKEFHKGKNIIYFNHFMISLGYIVSMVAFWQLLSLSSVLLPPILIIGCLIIFGSIVFTAYNRIMRLKNRALNARSNISGELKRRRDLISSLVEIVKVHKDYEERMFEKISKLRSEIIITKEHEKSPVNLNKSLMALAENYPELKAQKSFKNLMTALVDTEERIAYSREFYNSTVNKFNTLISQFPILILSFLFRIKKMQFINISNN